MKTEVVIFGIGGHAKVVHDILEKSGQFTPTAFISLDSNLKTFLDLPHYHQSEFKKLNFKNGVVAIGDNWTRAQVVKFIISEKSDFVFVKAIHPSSQIGSRVVIGDGAVIMAGSVINPDSHVGMHVIVNTSSSIDHDCHLGKFCSVAPGAVLGGNVHVGESSSISLGAKIIHGKKIGSHTIIGAGALVLDDIQNQVIAYGSPCKVIRSRKENEKYL
jgi:sugar O-acyltransferase (sialic acid O-acetyltransferase NeuD family)